MRSNPALATIKALSLIRKTAENHVLNIHFPRANLKSCLNFVMQLNTECAVQQSLETLCVSISFLLGQLFRYLPLHFGMIIAMPYKL